MKLKSIRAYGFKSFADKIDIELTDTITTVVGPNGSGKSNIVDAVRWVLGETSLKNLRSKESDDVIFAGSETRKPSSRAEVTLSFDNTDHFLNTDLIDVEVKRVLYRTGENEYYINGNHVRLKDVTNLFLDSGIGKDAFNIISQGSIEQIINANPEERRVLIEGTAGVLKYKTRKEESERKLEKTKDNLETVALLINEIKDNKEHLEKEATLAKKYLDLKEELKDLEISLTVNDIKSINNEYETLNTKLNKLNKDKEYLELTFTTNTKNIDKDKLEQIKIEEEINKKREEIQSLRDNISSLNGQKEVVLERQKYDIDKNKLDESIINYKTNEANLEKDITRLNKELELIDNNLKDTTKRINDISDKQTILNIKLSKQKRNLDEKEGQILTSKNNIEILEKNIEEGGKLPYAVKNIINNPRLNGIVGTISSLIEVEDKYMTAIDITLGQAQNFIVTKKDTDAKRAIEYLKDNKLGRATFFPIDKISKRFIPNDDINLINKENGFIGVASTLIKYDESVSNIIENQLGNVLIVDNLDNALNISKKLKEKYRITTLDGSLIHAGGSLTGGSIRESSSILKDKEKLSYFKELLKKDENELIIIKEEIDKSLKEREELSISYEETLKEKITIKSSYNETNYRLTSLNNDLKTIKKALSNAENLSENDEEKIILKLMDSIKELELKEVTEQANLTKLIKKRDDLARTIEEIDKETRDHNQKVREIESNIKDIEIKITKYDTKMDYLLNILREEYNMTFEHAKESFELNLEESLAREKVTHLRREISNLGEVNIGSIQEYKRVKERFDFLTSQSDELNASITSLNELITEMDDVMRERLTKAYNNISKAFEETFKKLFKGGEGKLKLTTDNILETGIDIIAEPPGKKLKAVALLSGGEKTLTAISLLFAILKCYPVPFVILDEVEAALDEANVATFGEYLSSQDKNNEFILITHKKKTMEYADTLYGITMQEQGVSKIVSVKLEK